MNGYKGFEKGLVCGGTQYAENTVFEEQDVEICEEKGMLLCENPFDVLETYWILNDDAEFNDFAEVEAIGDVQTDDHRNYCAKKLRVGAKLSFDGFVNACVNFAVEKRTTTSNDGNIDRIHLAASGNGSHLAASGNGSQLASSGNGSQLAASGDGSKLLASGWYSNFAASGDCSQLAASGYGSQLAASGDYSQLAASGNDSRLAASGENSQLAASGNDSQLAASGKNSKLVASGDYSKLASSGSDSVIAGIGINNSAKAKVGSWITLAEWKIVNGEYAPVCVKTERVDGVRIKKDTYYTLENGEFVEA